ATISWMMSTEANSKSATSRVLALSGSSSSMPQSWVRSATIWIRVCSIALLLSAIGHSVFRYIQFGPGQGDQAIALDLEGHTHACRRQAGVSGENHFGQLAGLVEAHLEVLRRAAQAAAQVLGGGLLGAPGAQGQLALP